MMTYFPLLLAQEAAASSFLQETFSVLDDEQRFVILLLAIVCTTGVIIIVTSVMAGICYRIQRHRQDTELKQDMLDRGMTAEEIAEVVKAAPIEDAASRWVEGWKQKKKT